MALKEAHAIPIDSPAYRRGVQYLMNSQLEDVSWRLVVASSFVQSVMFWTGIFICWTRTFFIAAASATANGTPRIFDC